MRSRKNYWTIGAGLLLALALLTPGLAAKEKEKAEKAEKA
jgi:hypothetical protein